MGVLARATVTSGPRPALARLSFHLPAPPLPRRLRQAPQGGRVGAPRAPGPASRPARKPRGGRQMIVQSAEIFTNSAHFILCTQADEGNVTKDSLKLLNHLTLLCKVEQASQVRKPRSSKYLCVLKREDVLFAFEEKLSEI